jgi:hypothetical protein
LHRGGSSNFTPPPAAPVASSLPHHSVSLSLWSRLHNPPTDPHSEPPTLSCRLYQAAFFLSPKAVLFAGPCRALAVGIFGVVAGRRARVARRERADESLYILGRIRGEGRVKRKGGRASPRNNRVTRADA